MWTSPRGAQYIVNTHRSPTHVFNFFVFRLGLPTARVNSVSLATHSSGCRGGGLLLGFSHDAEPGAGTPCKRGAVGSVTHFPLSAGERSAFATTRRSSHSRRCANDHQSGRSDDCSHHTRLSRRCSTSVFLCERKRWLRFPLCLLHFFVGWRLLSNVTALPCTAPRLVTRTTLLLQVLVAALS